MKIRHEINFLDRALLEYNDISDEFVYIDVSKFSGSIISYFEIVAKTDEDGIDKYVYLVDSSENIHATITLNDNHLTYTKLRTQVSTALTTDTYYLNSSLNHNHLMTARIIIIQDTGEDNLQDSETQIEIGDYVYNGASTIQTPLAYPKYWYYDSSKWDGTITFYAEVVWECTNDRDTVFVYLEEDDGSFGNWTTKETIVDVGATETVTRTRVEINPAPTSGRNYRLAYKTTDDKYGIHIYNAKIIVQQTATAPAQITKLEEQYLLVNTGTDLEGQLMDYDTLYDANEWDGVTVNLYAEHNAGQADSQTKLQEDPNGTPSDIANSNITGANRVRGGSAMTITDDETVDTYIIEAGTP